MRRPLFSCLALLTTFVLVLGLAACSSDDSDGSGSSSGTGSEPVSADRAEVDELTQQAGLEGDVNVEGEATATVEDGGSLETELDDFYFGPAFVEAPAGSTVTLELRNEGEVDHTFTIDSTNIDETLEPGKDAEVQVQVPDSGALAFYCRFHKSSGMQGAVLVQG